MDCIFSNLPEAKKWLLATDISAFVCWVLKSALKKVFVQVNALLSFRNSHSLVLT